MIPNVGDLVEYGPSGWSLTGRDHATYRVSGWMRRAPEGGEPVMGKKMQWCVRQEATHLSLSGITCVVAPVGECKVVGLVDWPAEILDQEQKRADRNGAMHTLVL
jgi:hypothetical protein